MACSELADVLKQICGARQMFFVFSVYRNADLNGRIFDCLLTLMAAGEAGDIQFDFATVSGCDQLVVGPTHSRGGTRDLLITDVPDLSFCSIHR